MPYIKQENRDNLDEFLNAHIEDLAEQGFPVGDVTYAVYKIVGHWFLYNPGYGAIADIRGMLAGVLSEFDRKFAFPYEEKKIRENGDVKFTLPPLTEDDCLVNECVICNALPHTFHNEGEDECPRQGCLGPRDCPCEDPSLDTRGGA